MTGPVADQNIAPDTVLESHHADNQRRFIAIEEKLIVPNKIRFDGTINLGHVLTFIGFMFAGTAMYMSLDKRVVVLETSRFGQLSIDNRRDSDMTELKRTVREDLQTINSKLDRLIERKKD